VTGEGKGESEIEKAGMRLSERKTSRWFRRQGEAYRMERVIRDNVDV